MGKELYESKVARDAAKRFRMLCEYSFMAEEGDGEDMPQENGGGDMPQSNTPTPDDMGGGQGMDDANAQSGIPGNDEGGAPGFNPQEGAGMAPENGGDIPEIDGMPNDMDTEAMQPEDEVIDVDELTSSQEETEEKVDDIHITMEKGFEKLLKVVSRLDKMIDMNTSNIENIKQEIEKRNPTPMEKLNMRGANDSYPFNIKPNDYWKEKEATSNYRIGGEDEPDAVQYTITQGDIDNVTDFKRISKELESDAFNQNLMNIFNLK